MIKSGNAIPVSVIRRLPKYLTHIELLGEKGGQWVSSRQLAEALGLTSSTVRQDLSWLDFSGISKRGYEIEPLERVLSGVLGLTRGRKAIVIGAGNLGRALVLHEEFARRGFHICGIFDADPALGGEAVGQLHVQGMEELQREVKLKQIDIGIIAVPASAAQNVADQLTAAGVRGILNLACAHVAGPDTIPVVDARMIESLQELTCAIKIQTENK